MKIEIERGIAPPYDKHAEFSRVLAAMSPGDSFRVYSKNDVQMAFRAARDLSPAIKLTTRKLKGEDGWRVWMIECYAVPSFGPTDVPIPSKPTRQMDAEEWSRIVNATKPREDEFYEKECRRLTDPPEIDAPEPPVAILTTEPVSTDPPKVVVSEEGAKKLMEAIEEVKLEPDPEPRRVGRPPGTANPKNKPQKKKKVVDHDDFSELGLPSTDALVARLMKEDIENMDENALRAAGLIDDGTVDEGETMPDYWPSIEPSKKKSRKADEDYPWVHDTEELLNEKLELGIICEEAHQIRMKRLSRN